MIQTFRERVEQLQVATYTSGIWVNRNDVLALTDEMDRKVIELQCPSCIEAEEKIVQLEAELAERTQELAESRLKECKHR